MKISLGDFCIRSYEFSDKESLVKYANNYNISKLLREQFPFPYTVTDAETWLIHACNQEPETSFVISTDKELIGAIGIILQEDVHRFSAEIGYWVGEPFWGKGIATIAVKSFTDFSFKYFNLNRIFANVFEGNDASEKVLIKSGYRKEATLKKSVFKDETFLDQYIYSIMKEDLKQIK